jgi:hypothetical protein
MKIELTSPQIRVILEALERYAHESADRGDERTCGIIGRIIDKLVAGDSKRRTVE